MKNALRNNVGNLNPRRTTRLILRTLRLCVVTGLFASRWMTAQAQTEVTATIQVLPPYSTKLADYADHPERTLLTLRNTTPQTLQVQLLGTITGENGIVLRTAPQFKSPQPLELAPFEVKSLNGDAFRDLYDVDRLQLAGVTRQELVQGNGLPEGIYTVCVQAVQYQTGEPLSLEAPMGCSSPIQLTNLEPPYLIRPFCGEDTIRGFTPQNLLFTWSFPAGAPPTTEYTLKVVEMIDPTKNPNDAFLSATTPAFFEETVRSNALLLGPAQPALVFGRRYAFAVTASDPFGQAVFRNGGRSEVCSFVYLGATMQTLSASLPEGVAAAPAGPAVCACQAPLPAGSVNHAGVKVGSKVQVGAFEMTVVRVTPDGNKLSGEGKIPMPLANSRLIPVRVQFSEMQVNAENQMLAGVVQARVKADVDFLPSAPAPNLSAIPFSSSDIDQLGSYFDRNREQLVSSLTSATDAAGFDLPLGLDKSVGGIGTVVAITGATWTPTQATFDAATVVDLVEAGMKAAFGAKGVCLEASHLCGQGTLYLAQDLNVASTGLVLKGAAPTFATPADSGTYVVFDREGFQQLRIRADYALPTDLFSNQLDPGQPVVTTLLATTTSWSDWLAAVTFDPFTLAGNTDFAFSLRPGTVGIYDHSSLKNPTGLPVIAEKPNLTTPDWNGIYLPEVLVDLPPFVKQINSTTPVTATANHLIIDGMGLTGAVQANNLLALGDGSLDSWYYSIDHLNVTFLNNSFKEGGMAGRVLLPLSGANVNDPTTQLNYTCTLSQPGAGPVGFQFVMQPKTDVAVPLWVARMHLLNTSNIQVTAGGAGNDFLARAVLNGSVDLHANLKPVAEIDFKAVEFEELVVQSRAPYVQVTTFRAGLASPQKSVGDFPVSLKDPQLLASTETIGLRFAMDVELADMPTLPSASFQFDLLGKIRLQNGRPDWGWELPEVKASKIALDGPVGPVNVNGFVEFFDEDATYGNGVRGAVKATMLSGLAIDGNALFGRKGFAYWYVDARLKLPPPGLPLAAPLPLSAFGFGGGAYYNLRQKPLPSPKELFDQNFTATSLYEPAPGAIGFKASVIMGISDGQLYQAEGTLEATLNHHTMALQLLKIDVRAAMLAPLMQPEQAVIRGVGIVQYDFAHDVFDLTTSMQVALKPDGVPLMEGVGGFALHINGGTGEWFMKMGDPVQPNELVLLDFASFKSYYMAGSSHLLPGMPEPPQQVIEQTGYVSSRPFYSSGQMQGLKLAFGASMQFTDKGPYDFTFLIFYAKVGAGIGFDVALQQYTVGCDGSENLPGINGWYANGQLWAWLYIEAGLDVDVWFFSGRVPAFKIAAAALLRAGLPNPVWFEGWFGGEYSVLGGLISGHMRFNMNYPKKGATCVPEANPFAGDPLISQINPTGAGISVMANPQVAFNYPVEEDLFIEMYNSQGDPVVRQFRLFITQFQAVNLTTGAPMYGNQLISGDHYAATLFTTTALDPQTRYRIEINVKVQEWLPDQNRYVDYVFRNAVVQQFDDRTIFRTGDCIKTLFERGVMLASYPFNKQRYLLQDESRVGRIILQKPIPCLFGDNTYELKALFISHGAAGRTEQEVPVQMVAGGQQLAFAIPTLPNDAITELQIIQRIVPKPLLSVLANATLLTSFKTRNLYATQVTSALRQDELYLNQSTVVTRQTSLSGLSLTNKKMADVKIYSYYFKTSKFNTLEEKVRNANSGVIATRKAFGLAESYDMQFNAAEGFDEYDVYGGRFQNSGGMQFSMAPLVLLTETDRWYERYARDYLYRSYWTALFGGYYGISLAYIRDLVLQGAPPTVPVSLTYPDPPLTANELFQVRPIGDVLGRAIDRQFQLRMP